MNCLMGDPTEEKILALLEPVANSGAEYFVIDAGWYAENEGWWEEVGEWEPSPKRFPSGFKRLLDQIRDRGLIPGLWIEPEVIGVRCPLAKTLSSEMFLQRNGVRAVEQGRYHLDFRHPDARARMDQVIDRLVTEYGVGYFKFDYNIEHVLGTDLDCFSAGQGQEGHSRAYLSWVNGLLDRHHNLVIENCSSGGQRMDYGMLSVHQLQSTSDQQDPVHYAAISASIPTAVIPEQSASWAYPQKEWSDEINALTVANSLLGRIHLSGRLDGLSPHQLEIVYDGMAVYKTIRQDLRSATPFWPLGLPTWRDHWLALGMRCDGQKCAYITVWRRGGQPTCVLPIDFLAGVKHVKVELLYPVKLGAEVKWQESRGVEVSVNTGICARLLRIDYEN
jgi:alpha-galactosidase